MSDILEFYDDGVVIENQNVIFSNGEIEDTSWNLQIPNNEHNKRLLNIGSDNVKIVNDCLVSIQNRLLLSKLNIDKINVQENTIDCTLYPNKVINDFMQKEIRKIVVDTPIKWDAFAFPYYTMGVYDWSFANHYAHSLKFYLNGANHQFLKNRVYGIRYNFDDNQDTYKSKGLGAFKDFQLHPSQPIQNMFIAINQAFRAENPAFEGDLIEYPTILSGGEFPQLISGFEKVSPHNRTQWCCFFLGKRNGTGKMYNDGRYVVPIEKLGSHICSSAEDDGKIDFNRKCKVQITKIHFLGNNGNHTMQQVKGKVKLGLFSKHNYEKNVVFEIDGDFNNTYYTLNGLRSVFDSDIQQLFANQGILNTLSVEEGDYLRLYIDSTNGKKQKVSFINCIIKMEYVQDSYLINDDDYDVDMEYYSGIKTQFKDIENADTSHLIDIFEEPYYDSMLAHFSPNQQDWEEIPTYNHYSFYNNLGELTPLKLLCDLCVKNGWYIRQKPNGGFEIRYKKPTTQLNDCELVEIDYLNERFGKINNVEYSDGWLKFIGSDTTNENLQNDVSIYQMSVCKQDRKYIDDVYYPFVPQYTQNGVASEDDDCKFNEIGNCFVENQIMDPINETKYFDGLIGKGKTYVYTFRLPTIALFHDFVVIDGLEYLVLQKTVNVGENNSEIKCVRL